MSDPVIIVAIVAAVFAFLIWVLRGRLASAMFTVRKNGITARAAAIRPQNAPQISVVAGPMVRRNWLAGAANAIRFYAKGGVLEDNKLVGKGNRIEVGAPPAIKDPAIKDTAEP
jgi:hypothetical protein